MKIIDPGHIYEIRNLDGNDIQVINFVNRNSGKEKEGIQNQDLLRILIDRLLFLDNQLEWDGNKKIIHHLRMALALHEARAIERKVITGKINPENIKLDFDGHFLITQIKRS